jgi:hypothetical protein
MMTAWDRGDLEVVVHLRESRGWAVVIPEYTNNPKAKPANVNQQK